MDVSEIPSLEVLLAQLDQEDAGDVDDPAVVSSGSPDVARGLSDEVPTESKQWFTSTKSTRGAQVAIPVTAEAPGEDMVWIAATASKEAANELDPFMVEDQRRAAEEAQAFKERRRKERTEREEQTAEVERRHAEAQREAWECCRMASEEAGERRHRALQAARLRESETRVKWKIGVWRRELDREQARKQASLDQERLQCERRELREERARVKKEEKMRRRVARFAQMAAKGWAFGPSGWEKVNFTIGEESLHPTPSATTSAEEEEEEKEEVEESGEGEETALAEVSLVTCACSDDDGVIDQRPRGVEAAEEIIVPLDELLASIDRSEMEDWETAEQPPRLDTVLEVIGAEMHRQEMQDEAEGLRREFTGLACSEGESDLATTLGARRDARVLDLAKKQQPKVDWEGALGSESTLRPFNDFFEEKQEGANSFEERQARSAAIQAKLEVARNRLSMVRWRHPVARAVHGEGSGGLGKPTLLPGGAPAAIPSAAAVSSHYDRGSSKVPFLPARSRQVAATPTATTAAGGHLVVDVD